jgi:uncharacterized membrane protein
MSRQSVSLALAASVATALAVAYTSPASAKDPPPGKESCFGIALKGHNDCAAGAHSCAGMSKASYSPSDFKFVPVGTCTSIKVKGHRGSLTAA